MMKVVSVNWFCSYWPGLNLILKHQCSFCSIKVSNSLAWEQWFFFYFSKYFFQKFKPLKYGPKPKTQKKCSQSFSVTGTRTDLFIFLQSQCHPICSFSITSVWLWKTTNSIYFFTFHLMSQLTTHEIFLKTTFIGY